MRACAVMALFVGAAGALLLHGGCVDAVCATPCARGQECVAGSCRRPCAADPVCADIGICVRGYCEPGNRRPLPTDAGDAARTDVATARDASGADGVSPDRPIADVDRGDRPLPDHRVVDRSGPDRRDAGGSTGDRAWPDHSSPDLRSADRNPCQQPGIRCDDAVSTTYDDICIGTVCRGYSNGFGCTTGCSSSCGAGECCSGSCSGYSCASCSYGCSCEVDIALSRVLSNPYLTCRSSSVCNIYLELYNSHSDPLVVRCETGASCIVHCAGDGTAELSCANGAYCRLEIDNSLGGPDCQITNCPDATVACLLDGGSESGTTVCHRACP